ncbi:protein kinase [Methanocorpusculum labreanum Z]|uniref:Protein kinase n=1 Tax=Methanocorpusculum labreanum (strain ATCC 43576 / DSM 4855 / Z) TaxID=410358 RepID=A2SU37_METLZ|nr:protein kinase [Methanocorpusculum labreanum]ABN07843.1 protein kinase [Methanocorpusculum labreanum Z]
MESDSFIDVNIHEYIIKEEIGKGFYGKVFRGERENYGNRAIKFVPEEMVLKKPTWEQEITKVVKLEQTEGVVRYHDHGFKEISGKKYLYIIWDYINGESLATIIEKKKVTIQMLIDIIDRTLAVFHACKQLGIQHADFHSGNIIIENPDPLSINPNQRRVFITDFGYGTFSPSIISEEIMDDYKGFARIIQECLESIDMHSLNLEDRNKYRIIKNEFPKLLFENDRTEGEYVKNPQEIRSALYKLFNKDELSQKKIKSIGDYLVAEYMGERFEDWEALFVPKFLAKDELFDKNICVLTGLRGCGKTTIFMRVSHDLKKRLGNAGIPGEDGFIGLYLNARTIAEAFPWLPLEKQDEARKQVINYFNLKWTIQILEWLRYEVEKNKNIDCFWISSFFTQYLKDCYFTSTSNEGIINTAISGCENELLKCKLGAKYLPELPWVFSDYDYLEDFIKTIIKNCCFAEDKDFFLFLDDYSSPMINECTQKILNPIIFRRTSSVFFKISTESVASFIPYGLNDKKLEENNDYKLIDLSIKSITNENNSENEDIINSIFKRRIERSDLFANYNTNLKELLGEYKLSDNERARKIIENEASNSYYGVGVFYDIWSSDIRELIKIFSQMVSEEKDIWKRIEDVRSKNNPDDTFIIQIKNQNNVFRRAGGTYLNLLKTAMNPCGNGNITDKNSLETYGDHLFAISSAFQKIINHDLKNKTSRNCDYNPPKQARRIEISDGSIIGKLDPIAECYYKGLIRYGVFVQDPRAKSVRSSIATRIYLRSLFVPYFNITFSKRDSITLGWKEFKELLLTPDEFADKYIKSSNEHLERKRLKEERLKKDQLKKEQQTKLFGDEDD